MYAPREERLLLLSWWNVPIRSMGNGQPFSVVLICPPQFTYHKCWEISWNKIVIWRTWTWNKSSHSSDKYLCWNKIIWNTLKSITSFTRSHTYLNLVEYCRLNSRCNSVKEIWAWILYTWIWELGWLEKMILSTHFPQNSSQPNSYKFDPFL